MNTFSPALTDLLDTQRRSRMLRTAALTVFWVAVIVGVVFFVLDNLARVEARDAAIAAITGRPESTLILGLPGMSWACSLVCGLPSVLGIGYAMVVFWESRGGGLDVAYLAEHRDEIVSVTLDTTSYQTKGGDELAETQTVVVTLANGDSTKLLVRSGDALRVAVLLRAELGLS